MGHTLIISIVLYVFFVLYAVYTLYKKAPIHRVIITVLGVSLSSLLILFVTATP